MQGMPLTPAQALNIDVTRGTPFECECAVATIELLARELGASHHVLGRMGCEVNITNPTLQQWIEWGKAKQKV